MISTLRALALITPLCLFVPPPASAQQLDLPGDTARPINGVLELFTSQGCSSCPAADSLLRTYIARKDVIALTLPVDYWDYLGWKDTYASPKNTARQRAYAKARGDGAIYTPQIVVDGGEHVMGSSKDEIDAAIERASKSFAERQVPVRFWNERNMLVIETGAGKPGVQYSDATIWVAVIQKSASVPVRGGENGGKTLTYYNLVREMTPVALWNGKPMTLQLARTSVMFPETEDCVVLIQEGEAGRIIGAALMGQ